LAALIPAGCPLIFCGLYQIVATPEEVEKELNKLSIMTGLLVVRLKHIPPSVFPPPDNGGTVVNVKYCAWINETDVKNKSKLFRMTL
jgi:hypothetical protein